MMRKLIDIAAALAVVAAGLALFDSRAQPPASCGGSAWEHYGRAGYQDPLTGAARTRARGPQC